ncbi:MULTISPECIES: (deoxy)nucleoside triphosphate pyrophosphohydrolase [unclassified Breznakia]|uniref:(deoxy)nucleoside triphosphate pyrophosphohydrolase n=1 Tax=unclassified Breznakia TaxID=2623764 RepID=UPI002476EDFA|nr:MULTISPECIES: (deoxy)nucleoside triphosphate pyrophosphohydrolase [unclassified Breznakia]MDH6367990.1 8-oxo-dGTP diphosphatase [Breznakia sp. PH1-1]MDH6405079.1 8-oxo-dGTP diphosphatase [Breznakia sp. PF1-11]MDH6412793.1 8-oxo-dGTP diphosphatase [Breznakia sp. PFB1-11]MDH6415154.1 8-oxo-dGTP diphosphatase [Breznakia sp. PFB1-14]MDH6417465.1 8-oxo-dGTP diphosphatase [Breznakia sp. PFB1-4]
MKKMIKVVAAIICDGDKILIAQRSKGELAGKWEFPGGKVEQGEDNHTALVREIKEELDMSIEIKRLYTNVVYEYESFILDMDCYICTSNTKEFTLLEHQNVCWIDIKQIDTMDFAPADISIINQMKVEGI